MVKQAKRLSVILFGLLVAGSGACGPDGSEMTAHVTIDVRCGSNTDCPSGFQCESEAEHGPPTTMCESTDIEASCPPGFETQVGYSQIFCKLPVRRAAAMSKRAVRLHEQTAGL